MDFTFAIAPSYTCMDFFFEYKNTYALAFRATTEQILLIQRVLNGTEPF